MFSIGRFFADRIRRILQRILIVGKATAPFRFSRRITWQNGKWRIDDRVDAKTWANVRSAGIGPSQTSIYVVMSQQFQRDQLLPWLDLTDRVKALHNGDPLILTREY